MPIQHAIWKVGDQPVFLNVTRLPSEQLLENMIVRDPRILTSEWMLVGRQEHTGHGGRIDLLAIAPDGSLILIELKRDRTPREIVAQALDYASWVSRLSSEDVVRIYERTEPASHKPSSRALALSSKMNRSTSRHTRSSSSPPSSMPTADAEVAAHGGTAKGCVWSRQVVHGTFSKLILGSYFECSSS